MDRIADERRKLLANALDRASTACFTVGIATPFAGYVYNVANFRQSADLGTLVVGFVGWLAACIVLHLAARRALKDLTG